MSRPAVVPVPLKLEGRGLFAKNKASESANHSQTKALIGLTSVESNEGLLELRA
jgi:hypothetical protein